MDKEANLRLSREIDLHLTQSSLIFIPPIDSENYKKSNSKEKHFVNEINKIFNNLQSKNVDTIERNEIQKISSSIQSIFTHGVMPHLLKSINNSSSSDIFQQQANRLIIDNIVKKLSLDGKIYNQLKTLSHEKQLELLFGKPGSNGGLVKLDNPLMANVLRTHFKDNPMQMVGKQFEPFGPYAWTQGIFHAMHYLNAFRNLTFIINVQKIKIFENKSYSDPMHEGDEKNLVKLVKDYGALLLREYKEFEGKGESLLGYFIDLSAKTRSVGMQQEQRFLFESYNIFE